MGAPAPQPINSPTEANAKRVAWIAGLLACVWLPSLALAGDSGALLLRGQLPVACSIQVDATQAATSLDLSSDQIDVPVASVTETCNSRTGYTVNVSSWGNGALYGELDAVAYQLKYDRISADLSGSQGAPFLLTNSSSLTGRAGVTKNVTISFAALQGLHGGRYEDTLVFTVAAK